MAALSPSRRATVALSASIHAHKLADALDALGLPDAARDLRRQVLAPLRAVQDRAQADARASKDAIARASCRCLQGLRFKACPVHGASAGAV